MCGAFPALVWSYAWALCTSLLIPPPLSFQIPHHAKLQNLEQFSEDSSGLSDHTGLQQGAGSKGGSGLGGTSITCFKGQKNPVTRKAAAVMHWPRSSAEHSK